MVKTCGDSYFFITTGVLPFTDLFCEKQVIFSVD